MLHEVDGFGRQQGVIVVLVSILDGSAIERLVPGMRGVLGARGCWMLELVRGSLNVYRHGDVKNPFVVVLIKGDTTIEGSIPVDGDIIQLLESLDEMVISFFAELFDTKVVDHKGEKDIFGGMLPKGSGFAQRGSNQTWKVGSGAYHLQCGRPISGLAYLCGYPGTPIRWMRVVGGCTGQ